MNEQPAPVLILAPSGRDAAVAAAILGEVGLVPTVCLDLDALVSGLDGAGGAIVTEEALLHSDRKRLAGWIRQQPPWSDFPFVLLTSRGSHADAGLTDLLGNVTVLERPFHPSVLANAVRCAIRARQRQREAEAYLLERKRSEEHQLLTHSRAAAPGEEHARRGSGAAASDGAFGQYGRGLQAGV
jgi:DNA-binding NtrC family response regulator